MTRMDGLGLLWIRLRRPRSPPAHFDFDTNFKEVIASVGAFPLFLPYLH